jgi:aminoglycoside phosphotransferase (APT) family kinase protein
MSEMVPLWDALSIHCAEEFPDWFEKEDKAIHRELIRNIPQWWPRIEAMPRTLVHNDFNPRNLCFRKTAAGLNLVAYDWELATLHLPQHDLAELLTFALTPEAPKDAVDHYLEHHRRALEKRLGKPVDPKAWRAGYRYCLWDLSLNRVAMYLLAHTFRHYPWMKRVVLTLRQLIRFEERATL